MTDNAKDSGAYIGRDSFGAPPDVFLADIQREQELEPVRGMSIMARIRLSYADMRTTTRVLIDERPTEGRLLMIVLLSDLIFFVAYGLAFLVAPTLSNDDGQSPAMFGLLLLGVLFLRTATLYLFSGVVSTVCRAFGGRGDWKATRTGVFWASLVSVPISVLGAIIRAGLLNSEGLLDPKTAELISLAPMTIGWAVFTFFVSAGVAEAHRFRRTSPVFMAFTLLVIAILFGGLFLYARFAS